jgi:hypothetical protein
MIAARKLTGHEQHTSRARAPHVPDQATQAIARRLAFT